MSVFHHERVTLIGAAVAAITTLAVGPLYGLSDNRVVLTALILALIAPLPVFLVTRAALERILSKPSLGADILYLLLTAGASAGLIALSASLL